MNPILQHIIEAQMVTDPQGRECRLMGHVGTDCGALIDDLIRKNHVKLVVEVGCAYGISSLYIGDALQFVPGARHIIIDPFQNREDQGRGIGLENLKRAGFLGHVDFREIPSEFALPRLLEEGVVADFVFLDGFHTFDHTALDFFYSDRLLKVGGIIFFDDVQMPAVQKVVRMALSYGSYEMCGFTKAHATYNRKVFSVVKKALRPFIKLLGRAGLEIFHPEIFTGQKLLGLHSSGVALIKTSGHKREWNWFSDF